MEDSAVRMMVEGGEMMLRAAGRSAKAVTMMKDLIAKAWSRYRVRAAEFNSMYPTGVVNMDMEHAERFMEKASKAGLPHAVLKTEGKEGAEVWFRKEDTDSVKRILEDIGLRDAEIKRIFTKKEFRDIGLHPTEMENGKIEAFMIPDGNWEAFSRYASEEGLAFTGEKRKGGRLVCTFAKQDRLLFRILRKSGIAPLSLVRAVIGETGKYRESIDSRMNRIKALSAKKKEVPELLRSAVPEK